jgi:hypothetical protein
MRRTIELVLDLHAISEGCQDKIVLGDPRDEGAAAV